MGSPKSSLAPRPIHKRPPAEAVDPLLNNPDGAAMLNVSVPTFWRRVADGTILRPIKLGAQSRWPQSELLVVFERAKAARNSWRPARQTLHPGKWRFMVRNESRMVGPSFIFRRRKSDHDVKLG
jgi:predicted DNA-binding transcriptional regulator AlpA